MDWNSIPNDDRLHMWKTLRDDISSLTDSEQLDRVALFFAKMPYGARTFDYYTPSTWPTPWEILYHGSFCKSSISLLIYYTFYLLHKDYNITLHLINDGEDNYLLPVIDNRFIMNYELGVVNIYSAVSSEFTVEQVFMETQIKKIT